jgi:predicted nucleic acid-binding protein
MLVFDATPLIYLAKAGKLDKLEKLEEEKLIPEKVYIEVVEEAGKEPDGQRIEKAVEKGILKTASAEAGNGSESLSKADLQVLKIAEEKEAVAVMDEEHGRNVADVRDIKTHGTAFIILRMQKKQIISKKEARETIEKIIDEGWYCSTDLYKDIMNKIEEIA